MTIKDDSRDTKIKNLEQELAKHKQFARWCVAMANAHGGADYCRVRSQVRMNKLIN